MTISAHNYADAVSDRRPTNTGEKRVSLNPYRADANVIGFTRETAVADGDIVDT